MAQLRRLFRATMRLLAVTAAALVLVACAMHLSNSGSADAPPATDAALRVATYNVHYIDLRREAGSWSVGDWERRKAPLGDAFAAVDADVIAFQEMESFAGGDDGAENLTLSYLLERAPHYAAAAVGDWRDFPSTQPILYRKARLQLLDQGWFFFSDTPDVIYSRTFDGSWPAFASWAEFEPVDEGPSFHVFNVHFEYRSGSNRRLSAELVRSRMAPVIAEGGPAFLVGDLNARAGSDTVGILEAAGLEFAPVEGSTYHFDRGINLFGAIDHIAATTAAERIAGPWVLRRKFRREWPTDHYPVVADYVLSQ